MRSSLSVSSGLPNDQFHQIQEIQETWEVLFCTNTVLWSCISMSSTSSNGILGEFVKTSAPHPRPSWRYFAGQKAVKRPRLPPFWRLPDATHAKHVGNFMEFQHHLKKTPLRPETLLSAVSISAGLETSWWTGRNPSWAGHNACEMVRKRREDEKSHIEQLQNQPVFQSNKLVHLG